MKISKTKTNIPKDKANYQLKPWEVNFRLSFGLDGAGTFPIEAIEHLARLMKQWIESSDQIITLTDFFYFQNLCGENIDNWSKTCPKLKEAYRLTLLKIAGNRERLSFFKEGDFKTFAFTQGLYSPQWKAQEKYFNDLKVKANSALASPAEYAKISTRIYSEIPGAVDKVPEQAYDTNKKKDS